MPTGPEFVDGFAERAGHSPVTDQQVARALRNGGMYSSPGNGRRNVQALVGEMRNHIIAASIGSPKDAVLNAREFGELLSLGTTRVVVSRESLDIAGRPGMAGLSPRANTSTAEPVLDDDAPFRPGGKLADALDCILELIASWDSNAAEIMAETLVEVELQYAPIKRACIRWGSSDGVETLETTYLPAQLTLLSDAAPDPIPRGQRRSVWISHDEVMYVAAAWRDSIQQTISQRAAAARAARAASEATPETPTTTPNATEADRAPPPPASAKSTEFTESASPQPSAPTQGAGYSFSPTKGTAETQATPDTNEGTCHDDPRTLHDDGGRRAARLLGDGRRDAPAVDCCAA